MTYRHRMTRGVRSRPVTSMLTIVVSIFGFWIGLVLALHVFPPARRSSFAGPLSFWDLRIWGYLFLGFGALHLLRLAFLWTRGVDFALHLLAMVPLLMWTVSTFFGPISTAQPAYSFVSVICLGSPFMTDVITRAQFRNARALQQDRARTMEYVSPESANTGVTTGACPIPG